MVHCIENSEIRLCVDTLGAELTSLRKAVDNTEYLWQGSKASWNGRSPVLFPIIGGLPNDRYSLDGTSYPMASHGFARKAEWDLLQQTPESLTYGIQSNAHTRAIYPFDFTFTISYNLNSTGLEVRYDVENSGAEEMFFSVGGHPGFRCPLEEGANFEDYELIFDCPIDTVRYMKQGKLLTGETRPYILPDGRQGLTHKLFKEGAIILRDVESKVVSLQRPGGGRSVTVRYQDFPDLGLWTYPASPEPYICIEPWFGVDSSNNPADADLRTKSGMVRLDSGGRFEASYFVELG